MIPRLYIDDDLVEGAFITLPPESSHYLQHVLRRRVGSNVVLFNGRQGEYQAVFEDTAKRQVILQITALKRPQRAEGDLWLCHAPLQRHALEYLVEKGTELGVSCFLPVMTQFSGPHRINQPRLAAIAREAAEQTERLTLPRFSELKKLEEVLDNWPAGRRLFLCAEAGETIPIADALSQDSTGPFAIMTGPEGGYAERELDLMQKFPFLTPVGLGPRILRAETAALAALAVFQALRGDGKEKAPRPMQEID